MVVVAGALGWWHGAGGACARHAALARGKPWSGSPTCPARPASASPPLRRARARQAARCSTRPSELEALLPSPLLLTSWLAAVQLGQQPESNRLLLQMCQKCSHPGGRFFATWHSNGQRPPFTEAVRASTWLIVPCCCSCLLMFLACVLSYTAARAPLGCAQASYGAASLTAHGLTYSALNANPSR